jgi:hypothetical protein
MKRLEDTKVVQNGWGLYIAIAIILLMWFGFSGCSNINVSNNITVKDIHRINSTLCIIDIYGNSSPDDFGDRTKVSFSFTDTCSEYVIGDTLFLKFVNKSN